MYGYLRTHTPELKVREQEYYRAVYCGLCRTMGKCTGQCSRMTLSYDFTLFALVRMALTGEKIGLHPRRCMVHPFKKRPMAMTNPDLALCAYASAILSHYKVKDDLHDERGGKRIAAAMATPVIASMRRRALRKGYEAMDDKVGLAMKSLAELEASRLPTVDQPATLFGELMGSILAHGLEGNQATLARTVGLRVGRWVYILDAADDYAEDAKCHRYNPLACLYGDSTTTLSPERRESLRLSLLGELAELEKAFDLLDTAHDPDLSGLLSNILYQGMPREAERVLATEATSHNPSTER